MLRAEPGRSVNDSILRKSTFRSLFPWFKVFSRGSQVAVALGHLLNHDKPDLILSGVNRGAQVIEQLMAMEWPQDVCLNVNFPSCAPSAVLPLKITRQGRGYLEGVSVRSENDPRGLEYHWLQLARHQGPDEPGTETAESLAGHITSICDHVSGWFWASWRRRLFKRVKRPRNNEMSMRQHLEKTYEIVAKSGRGRCVCLPPFIAAAPPLADNVLPPAASGGSG